MGTKSVVHWDDPWTVALWAKETQVSTIEGRTPIAPTPEERPRVYQKEDSGNPS